MKRVALVLSLAAHVCIIAVLVFASLGDRAPVRQWTAFNVVLLGTRGFGGDGHPEGEPADLGYISSPLPGRFQVPADRARNARETHAFAPDRASRAPVPVQLPARRSSPTTADRETPANRGVSPGHPGGLPHGSGGFGGGSYNQGTGLADSGPEVLQRIEPVYPIRARKRRITGKVVVDFLVTESGNVKDVRVIKAEPEGVFESCAIGAVQKWRFKPAVRQGEPTPIRLTLPIRFTLD